jgi:hypothetical protein
MRTRAVIVAFVAAASAAAFAAPPGVINESEGVAGGPRQIEAGQPVVIIHATVEDAQRVRAAQAGARAGSAPRTSVSNNLAYRGGTGGVGVETVPKIYLVLWGSQWDGNDPSAEADVLQSFFYGVGASLWLNSVTQYCQGVATGTVYCNGAGTPAGNQGGMLAGVWYDDASSAPTHPKQSQLAAEAVRAAAYFGNATAAGNTSAQYVIATATGNNSSGFGRQYCAWHSATSSTYGMIAYTNLPYITDAGASCGANFSGLGAKAGITIVEGHEAAESATDPFPSTGWLDSKGQENGDKCVWISSGQGAAANTMLSNGLVFPVQSLWSNAFNGGSGGCVLSYP